MPRQFRFLLLIALTLTVLFSGCIAKDLVDNDEQDNPLYSADRFYKFLQWKYYDKAATLVYPTDIPKFDEVAFRVEDDLNITSYELKELVILDPEDEEMPTTVRVVVTYYKFPSVAEKTAIITDTWVKPGKVWLMKSDFNSEIFND